MYSEYISNEKVALICPYILQRIHHKEKIKFDKEYDYIQVAITSGSLIRIESWIDVNGFWDELFIDRVDDDFCFALKDKGWKIIQTYKVYLEHEIGHPKLHVLFGKKFYTDSYLSFRYYYIARNTIIICRYYRNLPYDMNKILLKRFLKILFGENNKYNKMISFIKGIIDGRKMVKKGLCRNRI